MKRAVMLFALAAVMLLGGCALQKMDYSYIAVSRERDTEAGALEDTEDMPEEPETESLGITEIDLEGDAAEQVRIPSADFKADYDATMSMSDREYSEFAALAPTTQMSFAELVGDNGIYTLPEGFRTEDTYKIVVDLHYQVVMVYTRDDEGNYTVPVRYMLCTTGADSTPTPVGTYKMKNYRVRFALFNNTNVYGQYWSLITGRIYFHSILYSSTDASTYTTSSWKNLGHNISHGCVRLSVPDARWIWYNAAPGTTVEIRRGSSSDKETALIREQLKLEGLPDKRPVLEAGRIPWTDNWRIEDVEHEVGFVQGSQ